MRIVPRLGDRTPMLNLSERAGSRSLVWMLTPIGVYWSNPVVWDRGWHDGPRRPAWLAEAQPDVACLQEVKTSDETFPAGVLEEAGYGAIWHGQKGYNGVAILARGAAHAKSAADCRATPTTP